MRCSKTALVLGLLLLIGVASVHADDKKKGDFKKKGDDWKGPSFGDDDDDDDERRCSLAFPACPLGSYCSLRKGECKRCDRCSGSELQIAACSAVADTQCRKCSKLISNCYKCSSPTICTQCRKGYTLYALQGATVCGRTPPIGPTSIPPPPPSPAPGPLSFTLFTFEEFQASTMGPFYRIEPLPPHKGLAFANVGVANAPLNSAALGAPVSGLINGQVSRPMVAYTYPSTTGEIVSTSTTFNLKYLYLTAAWRNGMTCSLLGYRSGTVLAASTTALVTATGPRRFAPAGFTDIDRLSIKCAGGTWAGYTAGGAAVNADNVVIDNLGVEFTTKPVPMVG